MIYKLSQIAPTCLSNKTESADLVFYRIIQCTFQTYLVRFNNQPASQNKRNYYNTNFFTQKISVNEISGKQSFMTDFYKLTF